MRALLESLQECKRIARIESVGPGLMEKSRSGPATLRPCGQGSYCTSRGVMSSSDSNDAAESGDEEHLLAVPPMRTPARRNSWKKTRTLAPLRASMWRRRGPASHRT